MGPSPIGPVLFNPGIIRSSYLYFIAVSDFGRDHDLHRRPVLDLGLRHHDLSLGRRVYRLRLAAAERVDRPGCRVPGLFPIFAPDRQGLFRLFWALYIHLLC